MVQRTNSLYFRLKKQLIENHKIPEVDLNYKVFGQGEPVIILHGLFGMLDNWQSIARNLSEQFTVFAIDQRNHGRSSRSDSMNYSLMAGDLEKFMDKHWIQQATLIGHSMGGKTAMQFAGDFPDKVEKLIVVDIAPKKYPNKHQAIFDALLSVPVHQLSSRSEAEIMLSQKIDTDSIKQFLLKNISRNKNGNYEWKMNVPALYSNYDRILESVEPDEPFEKPTLFIRGENSNYILDEDQGKIHQLFPKADIRTIAHAGHWVHAEQPGVFLETVKAFLNN